MSRQTANIFERGAVAFDEKAPIRVDANFWSDEGTGTIMNVDRVILYISVWIEGVLEYTEKLSINENASDEKLRAVVRYLYDEYKKGHICRINKRISSFIVQKIISGGIDRGDVYTELIDMLDTKK